MNLKTTLPTVLLLTAVCLGAASIAVSQQVSLETVAVSKNNNYLVNTGLTEAFNSEGVVIQTRPGLPFYGQDADYQGKMTFAFQDNGDGTVTDLNTGLVWLREPSDKKFTWQQAMDYCEELVFAGRDDWRCPTLTELMSIEDFSDGWPYLNTEVFSFGERPVSKDLQFWSSNLYKAGTTHGGMETAFGLNFGTGHIKGYPTGDQQMPGRSSDKSSEGPQQRPPRNSDQNSDSQRPPRPDQALFSSGNMPPPPPGHQMGGNPAMKYVWAVAGDEYGHSKFIDNGDGTVTDHGTGLMWMSIDSGEGLDWEHALAYAEELEYAGYDDWRLPDVKELQSLVDYSGVYPAIDQTCFSITDEDAYFWSSTSAYFSKASAEKSRKYWAWYVAFGYAVGPDGKDSHGAGAVRYDSKVEGGPVGEDVERVYNFARAVRSL